MFDYRTKSEIERDELHGFMIEMNIATDEEISLVCSICGHSLETMEKILYSRTGYRSLEQYQDCECDI